MTRVRLREDGFSVPHEVRDALEDLFDIGGDKADRDGGEDVITTSCVSLAGTEQEVCDREVLRAALLIDQAYASQHREDDRRARDMLRELRGSGFIAAVLAIATFATSATVDRWLMGAAIVVLLLPQIVRAETPDPGEDWPGPPPPPTPGGERIGGAEFIDPQGGRR